MPVNPHFNNWTASNEQDLWEDLIIEAIQIYGIDVKYIPRRVNKFDQLYGEDQLSTYNTWYDLEVYVKSIDGFEGDGQFFSKWMGEMRDQVTFTISVRRFNNLVGTAESMVRPNEGDLIYFPVSGGTFQIKFVNTRPVFYQIGALQTYDVVCELFEYAGERFSTGITNVDALQENYSTDVDANPRFDLSLAPNKFMSDNEEIESEVPEDVDFSETNPFGDIQ